MACKCNVSIPHSSVLDDISVLIEGQPCVIDESSLSDTNIECTVPPKTWVKDDTKLVVRKRELAGGTRKKRNVNTTYLYKRAVGVNIFSSPEPKAHR